MLSHRSETILKSIVGQYIARRIPVPSQSIVNDYQMPISSATIRNEMSHLEQEGYITRLHHSGGGIPSDKGYRYYVETLSTIELPLTEQRLISHLFHQVEGKLEKWLSLATTVMAQLSQNMAVATVPKSVDCQFKHLELVTLQDVLALVVLVLRGARIKQQLITFNSAVSQSELMVLANKLNAAYSGLTSPQIMAKDIELSPTEQQLTDCILQMMQSEEAQEDDEPYLDGLHYTFSQPEFAQSQRMLAIMELIEHRNLLKSITPQSLTSHNIQVIIGKENKEEAIRNCSVVISHYGLPDEAIGTIGIIGPTRMSYVSAISVVSYLSSVLSSLVAELYGRRNIAHPDTENNN